MARNKTLELAQHFGIGPFAKKQRVNVAPPVADEPEKPLRRSGTLPDAPLDILFSEPDPFETDLYQDKIDSDRDLLSSELRRSRIKLLNSYVPSPFRTQIMKTGWGKSEFLKNVLGTPDDEFQEIAKDYLKFTPETFKKFFRPEKTPFAFRFQRDGMCYQVQFADAYGDSLTNLNRVRFQLSSQKPNRKYLVDAMPMRRAEAQFAIDVIAASLTIEQHEKYAPILQKLRDHLPTAADDLRNEWVENELIEKYDLLDKFKALFNENEIYLTNKNFELPEARPDRFLFPPVMPHRSP